MSAAIESSYLGKVMRIMSSVDIISVTRNSQSICACIAYFLEPFITVYAEVRTLETEHVVPTNRRVVSR